MGYFPIALTFGLLAARDIPLVHSVAFSVLVFAGASQFLALNLIHLQVPLLQTVTAAFLLNLRHFIMSSSLASRLKADREECSNDKNSSPRSSSGNLIPIISFGITDETFCVASMKKERLTQRFLLGLELISYTSWVSGTCLGYIMGSILPSPLQKAMGVALYALFAALLVPTIKKSLSMLAAAGCAAGINTLVQGVLSSGWALVLSIISASLVGALVFKNQPSGAAE
ncbi:MAG: AzlC family ABC transporter permease [Spirochaetota bacterium]